MLAARRRTIASLAASAMLVSFPSLANASLNIDLRATRINGVPISGANTPKSITVTNVGDVVQFSIYAVVVGTNGLTTDDKFLEGFGSFRSTGALSGNLRADYLRTNWTDPDTGEILVSGFDGLHASVGLQQDLDGDGDLDVGSNTDSDSSNYWCAHYGLAPAGARAGSLSPTTGGRYIGVGTFTVTSLAAEPTEINFFGRNASTASSYIQDGVYKQERSFNGLVPIQVLSPEPSAAAVGLLLGASLLRRRVTRATDTRPHSRGKDER